MLHHQEPRIQNKVVTAHKFGYLVALSSLLPICLLVARLPALPWEVLAPGYQVSALSSKVNDASIPTFPKSKMLRDGGKLNLVAGQELLVDNGVHCVVL